MTALQPPWATGTGGDRDEDSEWAPSNEPLSVFGIAEPGHGDVENAEPETQSYGRDDQGGGTTPDVRLNLLTDVREAAKQAAPVIEHHHVMENVERGAEFVFVHTERLVGGGVAGAPMEPVRILAQNPNRRRALVRVTSATTLLVRPARSGGISVPPGTVANSGMFPIDSTFVWECKSQDAIEAICLNVADVTDVAIYEEIVGTMPNTPGLAG